MSYLYICIANIACYIYDVDCIKYFSLQASFLFLMGLYTENISIKKELAAVCRNYRSAIYCMYTFVIIYLLGDIVPWSDYYFINFSLVIAVCILVCKITRFLKITPFLPSPYIKVI